jgi:hypothetical protein
MKPTPTTHNQDYLKPRSHEDGYQIRRKEKLKELSEKSQGLLSEWNFNYLTLLNKLNETDKRLV